VRQRLRDARPRIRAVAGRLWDRRPLGPGGYAKRHAKLVEQALASEQLDRLIATGERLPEGYGVGFDERLVEFPWLYSRRPYGRLLDAGSTLNHEQVLDRFQPEAESLCIATLQPEQEAHTRRRISYVYADLRGLPFRDGWFDTVICASTLEHVGMDNRGYGDDAAAASDPAAEQAAALAELLRVTAPGGRLLITVPYGRAEDHGWFRQYDDAAVRELLEGRDSAFTIYAYDAEGWQLASPEDARDASYRDNAPAARAVACIELRSASS
jgi:SAM-dependent methyltransferase